MDSVRVNANIKTFENYENKATAFEVKKNKNIYILKASKWSKYFEKDIWWKGYFGINILEELFRKPWNFGCETK